MPISPPTDPDNILSLVKDPGTRFDTDHLVVNRVATWLALDDQHNAWITAITGGYRLSANTYNLLVAGQPVAGSNTFKVTIVIGTASVDIFYELRPELRNGVPWAVAETV